MKRVLIWIVVVVVIGAIAGGLWYRNQQLAQAQLRAEILRTAEVTLGNIEITIAASGNVVVAGQYDLTFTSQGTVRMVDVEAGDRVEQGQVLAQLDDTSLVDAMRQVELDLTQAEINLRQLQKPATESQIAQAELSIQESVQAMQVADANEQVALTQAQIDETRAQQAAKNAEDAYNSVISTLDRYGIPEAYGAGVTASYMQAEGNVGVTQLKSDYAIQQAQSQYLSAYERYRRASQSLTQLKDGADAKQVRNLELALAQVQVRLEQAKANLDSVNLTAPVSGIVSAVNVQANTPAVAGLPAVTILDDSTLYVDLLVDEIDIGNVRQGQDVQLVLDAYPDTIFAGTVERIEMLAQTGTGTVTYPVRIQLGDTQGAQVREGMTASATITTGVVQNVLIVPNWAVQTDQTSDQIYTYVVSNGTPERAPITIGVRNDSLTQVTSGLDQGATVALVAEPTNLLNIQGPASQSGQ